MALWQGAWVAMIIEQMRFWEKWNNTLNPLHIILDDNMMCLSSLCCRIEKGTSCISCQYIYIFLK
jgi:hypothetical protein